MMWLLAGTAAGLLLFGELEQIFNLINTLECRVEKGEAKGGIRRKKLLLDSSRCCFYHDEPLQLTGCFLFRLQWNKKIEERAEEELRL